MKLKLILIFKLIQRFRQMEHHNEAILLDNQFKRILLSEPWLVDTSI